MKHTTLILLLLIIILTSSLIVCANQKEIGKAEELWSKRQTQGQIEKAIAILEEILVKEPDNYEALWRLGEYYEYLGNVSMKKSRLEAFQKGYNYTEKAIKLNEKGVKALLWNAILQGSILQEKNDLNPASLNKIHDQLQVVIKLEPHNADAHLVLAQLYYIAPGKPKSVGDKKKAIDSSALAVKHNPEKAEVWMFYGWLLMENGNIDSAKTALTRGLDLSDDFKKYSQILQQEAKVGDNYESLWRLAYLYEFIAERCQNKKEQLALFEKGLKYAERAIKVNPKGVDGYLYKAILIGDIGLTKGIMKSLAMVKPMLAELETVIKLDPKNGVAYNVLSELYSQVPGKPLSIGDKKKAQEYAALAVKYEPNSIDFWFSYGKIAAENKDYSTARIAYQRVLSFFGEYYYYKVEAEKELAKLQKK